MTVDKAGSGSVEPDDFNALVDAVNADGAGSIVSCVISRDNSIDVHDLDSHPFLWDALYDNYSDFNTLSSIPDGLGLTFAFDGSSADITTDEAGVWAFYYNLTMGPDDTWRGALDTRFGSHTIQVSATAGSSIVITQVLALPAALTFGPQLNTTVQATADPFNLGGAALIATRLG